MSTTRSARPVAPRGRRTVLACLAAASAMAFAPAALGAGAYTAVTIPNSLGGTGTEAYGVNDAGVVVGKMDDAGGNIVGFVSINGVVTTLPVLTGGGNAWPTGVNGANVIVGSCNNAAGISRAVTWTFDAPSSAWTITELPTLRTDNAGLGVATRINSAGVIVGYASSDAGGYHACTWTSGVPHDLGTASYSGSLAFSQGLGINDNGDTCGYAYRTLGGPEHGWVYRTGTRGQEEIIPGGDFPLSQWHAVNASGVMFGYMADSTTGGDWVPAIHTPGQPIQTVPLAGGVPEGFGYDLNDDGVGVGRMFLLNPHPQPNVEIAFKYENGSSANLNDITTGLPGNMFEARDVSNTGLIVGTAENGPAPIAVLLTPVPTVPPCPADYNHMNGVDLLDIFAFLNDWFAGRPEADFNGRDGVDLLDIFAFLNAWFAGPC